MSVQRYIISLFHAIRQNWLLTFLHVIPIFDDLTANDEVLFSYYNYTLLRITLSRHVNIFMVYYHPHLLS